MSSPGQPLPPPREPRRHSGTLLAAIVVAVVLMAFGCAGVCAGVLYFAAPRARVVLEQANLPVPNIAMAPDVNDWMMTRTLSQIYTNSLAAVVGHKAVIERLGEPVVTDIEADELYRRKSKGVLGERGEEIEFDIKGPQGTGVVTVRAVGPDNITNITVTLGDGSTIDVPPLPSQPFIVR